MYTCMQSHLWLIIGTITSQMMMAMHNTSIVFLSHLAPREAWTLRMAITICLLTKVMGRDNPYYIWNPRRGL